MSSSKNNGYIYEQQNDVRLNDLSSKISAIKNITIDIHQDVTDQDRLLDESHNQFSGLGHSLSSSFGKMNRMISKRRQRQLCFYVTIIIFVFFIIYYGAPIIKSLFGTNSDNSLPDDTTLSKQNAEDM
ncbi:uncharacterized protein BX663DRAFT_505507 [Cokeromyces recurvatus]|uniref:uncharacterized protein n=1 Tax=Cokeromyces recurvatus TaxID=90255 RepID=UPI00221F6C6F|nr:uncharacterized protein BX663DRAFT_505507 [Cokeromyces recurvatus]KAI7903867.1 hypothetical protein BX663DRAFT_505507 [Cokeromyces recurvatus]